MLTPSKNPVCVCGQSEKDHQDPRTGSCGTYRLTPRNPEKELLDRRMNDIAENAARTITLPFAPEKAKEVMGNKRIDDIVAMARERLEDFGDLHDEGCPCTLEGGPYPDACDCATMDALEAEVRKALGELDAYWLKHLMAHRPYCSPTGNKMLTKIKRNLT